MAVDEATASRLLCEAQRTELTARAGDEAAPTACELNVPRLTAEVDHIGRAVSNGEPHDEFGRRRRR